MTNRPFFGELIPMPPEPDTAWRWQAACRNCPDPNIFFPDRGMHGHAMLREALTYCDQCVVRDECLAVGMSDTNRFMGVWGGTSRKQRIAMRKEQEQAQRKATA